MEVSEAVVLITGASSGIGRAAAVAFDAASASVAMAARRVERLEELAKDMSSALVVPTDLSIAGQAAAMVDATLEHFGRIDVLINNAGYAIPMNSDALDPAETRRSLEVHLVGAMIATRQVLPSMLERGRGHIINVCSPSGLLGVPLMADYCAGKAAMIGWTRALQAEWVDSEISVTEYEPGRIDTEFGTQGGSSTASSNDGQYEGTGPLGPLPAERVASQLVDCVRRPRPVMYSSLQTRVLCWLLESARVRRSVGSKIGTMQRKHLGLPQFSTRRDR